MRFRETIVVAAICASTACGALENAPKDLEFLRRGDELVKAKRYREAADSYRLAVRSDPRNGQTRLKLADALLNLQDGEGHRHSRRTGAAGA